MSYTALYRKYRPQTFDDVKGQDHIVNTLRNQVNTGRLGHAYLFCGTRGTGKTTIAKILAKTVNCQNPTPNGPCGECESCRTIAEGNSMNVIEIDAASNNGVNNIRDIIEEVTYSPVNGKYKVYIVDEVHMLSPGAFNALLKTLEEPPSYVIFILATTEVHKIPITILSRCQRYDFKRIGLDTISDRLKELTQTENLNIEDKALRYVARVADGSMRDALSLLDQCVAFACGEELTYDKTLNILGAVDTTCFSEFLRIIIADNIIGAVEFIEKIILQGRELGQFVSDFVWYLRNLMLVKSCGDKFAEDVLDISTDHMNLLKEEAEEVNLDTVFRYINVFSELSSSLRYATQKRIMIEMAIVKLCRPQMESDVTSVLERVRVLEDKAEKGTFVTVVNSGTTGSAPVQKAEPKPLPKSLPDDIKAIINEWYMIVGKTENSLKAIIEHAKLSLSENGNLAICVENTFQEDALNREDTKQELESIISNHIEKEVHIEVRRYDKTTEFNTQYVDLQSLIGTDIIVEEN